jgi:DNA-binding winged helix-turn-helix (wHTH) protein
VTARIRFGVFEADLASGELYREGRLVPLQQQPFEVLRALVERAGEVVTREALRKRLWPEGVVVDFDQSLNKSLTKLRDALGDSAANPRFIQTLPKRGYRFIAPVAVQAPWPPPAPPPMEQVVPASTPRPRASSFRSVALGATTLTLGVLFVLLLNFRPDGAPRKPGSLAADRRTQPHSTPIAAARDAYERGRLALARGSEASVEQSVQLFARAIAFSPRYAEAYAEMACALSTLASESDEDAEDIWRQARTAAAAALTINPTSSKAHAALGRVALLHDQDWLGAEAHFRRGIALDGGNAVARTWYALALSDHGRHEEAEAEARRALAADPHALATNTAMGAVLYQARRYSEAAAAIVRVIEIDPDYPPARRLWRQLAGTESAVPLALAQK